MCHFFFLFSDGHLLEKKTSCTDIYNLFVLKFLRARFNLVSYFRLRRLPELPNYQATMGGLWVSAGLALMAFLGLEVRSWVTPVDVDGCGGLSSPMSSFGSASMPCFKRKTLDFK